jgi:hypothetical protein
VGLNTYLAGQFIGCKNDWVKFKKYIEYKPLKVIYLQPENEAVDFMICKSKARRTAVNFCFKQIEIYFKG